MILYNITTPIGTCVCYEKNGIYFPYHAFDEKFLFESIINIERIDKGDDE
jgi:hypothetical protein